MTKDWDSVQDEIKDLSWAQKKRLDEVKKIMESKYGFKASTRAYRMKLAEWGCTRKAPRKRKANHDRAGSQSKKQRHGEYDADGDGSDESDSTMEDSSRNPQQGRRTAPPDPENLETMLLSRAATMRTDSLETEPIDPNLGLYDASGNILQVSLEENSDRPYQDPAGLAGSKATGVVMSMLGAILEPDSQKLESILMKHPNHINLPIGLPFDVPNSRFFNHPAMLSCVILQHPDQTIFDIACGLDSGPIVWILLAHGAKGSRHPFGPDLALHNAIKNGRTYTVQALLMPGRSKVNGEPGVTWKPLLQAVYWNQPDIVRMLIDRGASINDTSPWLDGKLKSSLQFCLDRRQGDYRNPLIRGRCEKILKMLLNAGADILPRLDEVESPTPFEIFLKPWQGDVQWIHKLSPIEMECLEAFVRKGADLKTTFAGFLCEAPSSATFEHQVLWHSTAETARLLIDQAAPNPDGNGSNLLHEIVGSCPNAKRHPSDTLRDIEVLLKRGADPNLVDSSSFTPLRRCIERCPAVDIVPRLRMLLDGGADPELKHSNRLPPFVLAARTFEEPLRSQVMDFLVVKMKGRQPRVVYDDSFTWNAGYFPIPDAPTFSQVQTYSGMNGDFNANLARMIPEDVLSVFQRACFSVASMNYLNAATAHAKMTQPLQMTAREKDEIFQVIAQRQASQLPEYRFDQGFVMGLLKPQLAHTLANYHDGIGGRPSSASQDSDFLLPHHTPILSSAPTVADVLATSNDSASRRMSITSASSSSSNDSASSFLHSTTLVRCPPNIGERSQRGDVKRAIDTVLKYTCKVCGGGNLLTKAEIERHKIEHEHSRECVEARCPRRFCVGRHGIVG